MVLSSVLALIGLPELGFIIGVAVVIFGCTAVMQNPFISTGQKTLWILTILVLNWIGLLWYYYNIILGTTMKTDGQKKILITGASGFIGGFLVKEAQNRGYEVWAGVRAGSNLSNLNDKRIKFIDLPYKDEGKLKETIERFAESNGKWDYVIHNTAAIKQKQQTNSSSLK